MKRSRLLRSALLGALTSLPVIALSYLGEVVAGLPFVAFDIFDWVARTLPGGLITFGIDTMVAIIRGLNLGPTSGTAKLLEQIMAVAQLIGGGAVLGFALAWIEQRRPTGSLRYGLLGGAALFLTTALIELSLGEPAAGWGASLIWLGALFLAWGSFLQGSLLRAAVAPTLEEEEPVDRRGFLQLVGGGSLAAALAAFGLGRLLDQEPEPTTAGTPLPEVDSGETTGPAASPSEEELADRISPAPGTRPELTSNEDFYRIDINTSPPEIDASEWTLKLEGLVDNPMTLTIDDIVNRRAVTQAVTMQCISNPIGGDLTGTSRWTGTPVVELLQDAGMRPGALELYIESADGFYESVAMADIIDERTLLVYAMNGVPLPIEHGFPLRIYIPNRYGMKQPKWITRMEVIDNEGPGYWVERGWSAEAFANTTSVVDTVAVEARDPETGTVPIGGIAWAGERGISKVEVQVDEGDWVEAELRVPPLSPLTWVQWRYDWPYEEGSHEFRVRAYDQDGEMQTLQEAPTRPDGATGIHTLRVRV